MDAAEAVLTTVVRAYARFFVHARFDTVITHEVW